MDSVPPGLVVLSSQNNERIFSSLVDLKYLYFKNYKTKLSLKLIKN